MVVWTDSNGAYYAKDMEIGPNIGNEIVTTSVITAYGASIGAGTEGATTTTAAIQEAINVVHTAAGGHVFLKRATYSCTTNILIYSNITLEGETADTTIQLAAGSWQNWSAFAKDYYAFINTYDSSPGTPAATVSNVTVRSLTIDFNQANQTMTGATNGSQQCLRLQWAQRARVEDCRFINAFNIGFSIYPSNTSPTTFPCDSYITNCIADSNGNDDTGYLDGGFLISDGTGLPVRVICKGLIAINNNGHGISIEDSQGGVAISNPICYNNVENGICASSSGSVSGGGATITGGMLYKNKIGFGSSIAGSNLFGYTLTGVQIFDNTNGVFLYSGNDCAFVGCNVSNNGHAGFYLTGAGWCTISGCVIQQNGTLASTTPYGIYVVGSSVYSLLVSGCIMGNDTGQSGSSNQTTDIYEAAAPGGEYNVYVNNIHNPENRANMIVIASGSQSRVINNKGPNPLNKITNPFGTGTIGLGGSAAVPTASTQYLVTTCDIFITAADSSNSNNDITVEDGASNTVQAGLHTLTALYVPVGWIINWHAFTGTAGAVTVWGT